jgi:hypothetical protein
MPVSNEEIMEKLNKIESTLNVLAKEGEKAFEEIAVDKNRQYTEVEEWRSHVWENCPHRKEDNESEEIDFICEKTKKSCTFDDCPENVKG